MNPEKRRARAKRKAKHLQTQRIRNSWIRNGNVKMLFPKKTKVEKSKKKIKKVKKS